MSDKRSPGRPSHYPEAATERLHIRVTPAQRLELRRVAVDHGTGLSDIIRELIDERFEDRRPFPPQRK